MELRIRGVESTSNEKIHDLEKEHSAYKLHVANEYASWNTVQAIEGRLGTRIDAVTEAMIKMPDVITDRITKLLALAAK